MTTFLTRAKTDLIVIHCSATDADQNIGAREIEVWHRQRGFIQIGYHYVIRRSGVIEYGRLPDKIGAHALGHNHRSIGICMVGGGTKMSENNFTEAQWQTLYRLLTHVRETHPKAEILGHRDLPDVKKACPSFDVRTWLKEVEFPEAK